ncbi:hypothetical protein [Blattabacterium cuenoti]|uniref:hypothetical protein n=1 Tax=Blattabacterium cuenoti TaxID=1653831 RepID=UPI00163C7E26|nr:hypothetical protein [Blattabacterium cuenoti]
MYLDSRKNIIIKNQKIEASISSLQSQIFTQKNKFFIEKFFCNSIYYYPEKLVIRDFFIKTSNSFLRGNFSSF